jgi:hypothetical protein
MISSSWGGLSSTKIGSSCTQVLHDTPPIFSNWSKKPFKNVAGVFKFIQIKQATERGTVKICNYPELLRILQFLEKIS